MNILHITTNDYGGAGKATLRLHLGLKEIGINSKVLVLERFSSDNEVIQHQHRNTMLNQTLLKIYEKLISYELSLYNKTRPKGLEPFSDLKSTYFLSRHPFVKGADIIHLHWVGGFVNYTEFFRKVFKKPIVWTLHDMNPFTGGCHYTGGCRKYETGCGSCPQLGSNNQNDLSKAILRRKQLLYRKLNLTIVTPSVWLSNCAKNSLLLKGLKTEVIPLGIPISIFKKHDKTFCRDLLNLPQDKKIILFGAAYKTERKGLSYLLEALRIAQDRQGGLNMALAIFGDCVESIPKDIKMPIHLLGRVRDELLLSCCYSAADIFALPSLEENLSQTALEAMGCSTPVVGFDIGGNSDIIKSKETGFLVKEKTAEALSEKISWMINHPNECEEMGYNGGKRAEKEHSLGAQAQRYEKIYQQII
jgi:glycosyltransferase involved in cell wall biosynthesis